MKHALCTLAAVLFVFGISRAQFPAAQTSSEIYHDLIKAGKTGSVLYIAAHPDDENTRLISYFENAMHARTAYLSLTRGDGGQNLVGTEIGAAMGVLRTQELMAARSIDGGEQFFTRAVDFGYSKSSVETLEKWDKEAVLSDVVLTIRKFRPDVLVTRFPPNNYAGHGHHEASALLAEEAFEAAADPGRFPEQLKYVATWQPKRLYFNTSSWWIKDLPERARNNENFVRVNVGDYSPLLGETYARIASRSRSQHKSQGFGTDVYYGLNIEYMEYVKGEKARSRDDILEGVDQSWARLGAEKAGKLLDKAIRDFDFGAPEKSVPLLLDVLAVLTKVEASPLRDYKIKELELLIAKAAGIFAEAVADDYYYTPGSDAYVKVNIQHQHKNAVMLNSLAWGSESSIEETALRKGDLHTREIRYTIPKDAEVSNHYWLRQPYENLFSVEEVKLIGLPENPPALSAKATLEIEGYLLTLDLPVEHKAVDPVKAVIYRPVNILPPATFRFSEEVIVRTGTGDKTVVLYVSNHEDDVEGSVELILPKGWKSQPASRALNTSKKGAVQRMEFNISGGAAAKSGEISVKFDRGGKDAGPCYTLTEISYDHIPDQIFLKPATIKLKSFDLERGTTERIGYIEGPGDDVAKYLKAAGYEVETLTEDAIQSGALSRYDAVITGIRAYNTRTDLAYLNDKLNAYVENGGTWLVQYNTSRGLKSEKIGPYPFTIGRERVTDEMAEPTFPDRDHPSLTQPNLLNPDDFDGWVQERGLYFAADWDEAFTPVIGWSDPGEPERRGGLIAAPHGKGYFVYSGISFFRQLPAGVPGAYKLLANILNLKTSEEDKP